MGGDFSGNAYKNMIHDVKSMDINTLEKFAEKKDFEKNELYTNSYKAEDQLYNVIYKQAYYSNHYGEYVDSVLDRQENEISVFDKNEYSKRLRQKIKTDFSQFRNVKEKEIDAYGMERLLQVDCFEIIMLGMCFLLAYILLIHEKEQDILSFYFTMPNGRKGLGLVKYGVGVFLAGITAAIFYVMKCLIIYCLYGFGNPVRKVQNLYIFKGFPLIISQGKFLVVYGCFKILVGILFFSIFYVFILLWKKRNIAFTMIAGIFFLESYLWLNIQENSWLYLVRRINLIQFMDIRNITEQYSCVNVLNYPIDTYFVLLVSGVMLVLLLGISGFFLYPGFAGKNGRQIEFAGKTRLCLNIPSKLEILFYEMKKYWVCEKGWMLLLAVLGAGCFISVTDVQDVGDVDKLYYEKYMMEIHGKTVPEAKKYMQDIIKEIETWKTELESGKTFSSEYTSILESGIKREKGANQVYKKILLQEKKKASHILYEKGYLLALGIGDEALIFRFVEFFSIIAMAIFAFCVYGVDNKVERKLLLYSTYYGKNALVRSKYKMIFFYSLFLMGVLYGGWLYSVSRVYSVHPLSLNWDCIAWNAPFGIINTKIGFILFGFYGLHLLVLNFLGIVVGKMIMRGESA
ncbi:hypothetical protein KQI69_02295 [Eubacterium sp. MSJ-13]|uniref:hypothetical protein n=1 Tax=Eubacterium sp. MSJ-13 TaxID=2841513 RepID=UPI001C105962|nr:hypothetical protein [Eubacterium sp. MSJ-13]MBU5478027.1 hypothetical protein [Eubacterium sp. MSJ-13]